MKNLIKQIKPFRTKGGIHISHNKNTAARLSVVMPPPKHVIIPMLQHIGAPCNPIVKVGDKVKAGQVIGDSSSFVSAPIHSSISGVVKEISSVLMPNGVTIESIVIESDGLMEHIECTPPDVSTNDKFLKAVRESGLVGLGGAGFPAHVKLRVPADKVIDTLLINGAECEPFITSDHREIMENSWSVMSGIYAIKELLGIHKVIIGVESNKPDAIELLKSIADNKLHDPKDEVKVMTLKALYPQGAEKMLVQACTGRRIPPGKLPSDVGCVVMNVTSVAFLAQYLKSGIPLITKRITVDGSAIKNPQNVIVPVGTPIKDIIEFCGGYSAPPKKILYGGPMMGLALSDDSLPILKQTNAIIAFAEKEAVLKKADSCIRCGRCIDNCPMSLMPVMLSVAAEKKDLEKLKKYDLSSCLECGSCSFVCPAHRHILQSLRIGKQLLKEEKPK
ncbi:MAG: electron transporter RnfC [Clostridiales bacterium GWF2_36_10]|nr:MAG: electron transporter RnfC [Clostridiales bacterium GWF2_36_10]HAN21539.1 electron transport complex subunit RsxC [Clostridiales bacterium]